MTAVKLWAAANWDIGIPAAIVDPLTFEEVDSLIAALHEGGADETTHYSGIVATYCATTEAAAMSKAIATLQGFFPGMVFEAEGAGA